MCRKNYLFCLAALIPTQCHTNQINIISKNCPQTEITTGDTHAQNISITFKQAPITISNEQIEVAVKQQITTDQAVVAPSTNKPTHQAAAPQDTNTFFDPRILTILIIPLLKALTEMFPVNK